MTTELDPAATGLKIKRRAALLKRARATSPWWGGVVFLAVALVAIALEIWAPPRAVRLPTLIMFFGIAVLPSTVTSRRVDAIVELLDEHESDQRGDGLPLGSLR